MRSLECTVSYLTSEACSRLLQRAVKDGILCPEDTSSQDPSLRGLRQSFWQQFVCSGLLQRLPALLNQAEKLVQTRTASSGGSSQNVATSLASGHGRNTSTKQASSTKRKAQHGTAASSSTSPAGSKACPLSRSDPVDGPTTLEGLLTHPATVALRHTFCLFTLVRLLRGSAPGAGQAWPLATDVAALQLAMACIRGWSAYIRRLPDGADCEQVELPLANLTTILGYLSTFMELCQVQRSTLPLPVLLPCCVLETMVRTYAALLAEKQHLPGGMQLKAALATPTATNTAPNSHGSHGSSSNNSPQAPSSSCSRADSGATQQPSVLAGSSTKPAGNRSGRAANAGRNNTVDSSVQAGAPARTSSEEQLSISQVWHIACTQQQAIPEDHTCLLELLGVDGRTILVMAAEVARESDTTQDLWVPHRLNYLRAHLLVRPERGHVLMPPEVALLTSAPAMLCYWIAHTNSHDKNYATLCKLAAETSHECMLVAAAASSRAHVFGQVWTQEPAPPGIHPSLLQMAEELRSMTEALLAGARGTSSYGAMGPRPEMQPDAGYSIMLDRMLCSVLKVLPRLNRKLLRHASSPAGGSPAGDNSSKQEALLAVERVMQLAAYIGSPDCHQASPCSHSPGPHAEAEAVWQRLAVPLSNVLERFVRSQAAPERLADLTSRACSAVRYAATCLSSVDREGQMCCLARAMIHPECSYHHRAQLLSLVFSLIKYCSSSRRADVGTQDFSNSNLPPAMRSPVLMQVASDCCYAATMTAVAMLDTVQPPNTTSSGSPHSPDSQLAMHRQTMHCPSSCSSTSTSSVSNAACDLGFACLAAFGRCCMEWAQQLQETPLTDLEYAIKLPRYGPGSYSQQGAREGRKQPLARGCHVLGMLFMDACPTLLMLSLQCGQWMTDMQEAMRQTAAGCNFSAPQEQINQTFSAVKAVTDAVESKQPVASLAAAVADLVQQLQQLGEALNTLPHPHACNNPHCSTTSSPSDVQLVSGKSCLCAGCLSARYCSRACQKQHRKQHRAVCKARGAAALHPVACPEVV